MTNNSIGLPVVTSSLVNWAFMFFFVLIRAHFDSWQIQQGQDGRFVLHWTVVSGRTLLALKARGDPECGTDIQ